jgi:hypothetical protein
LPKIEFSPRRHEGWTDGIAVGSMPFVEKVKTLLGFRAKGRDVAEGPENAYFWNIISE